MAWARPRSSGNSPIGSLLVQGPPTPAPAHLDIDSHGLAWLPEDDFVKHFAADVDPVRARVMHVVQQPLAASTLQDVMGVNSHAHGSAE